MTDDNLYIAISWFSQIEFEKIKALPGSGLTGTFQEWEQLADRVFNMMGRSGPKLVKVEISAGGLCEFAKSISAENIDASVRFKFAAILEKGKSGTDSLPVNFVVCPSCSKRLEPVALLPEGPLTLACDCGRRVELETPQHGFLARLKRLFRRGEGSKH